MKQSIIILLLAGGTLFSCDSNSYKTTESGIKYKYIEEGDGEAAKPGEVMLLNISYKDGKDSVLFSSEKQGEPMPMPVDSTWSADGSIYEIMKMLKEGDSVEIQITSENFFAKTVKQPMPDTLDGKSIITFQVGLDSIMEMEAYRTYQMKQFEKMQQEEAAKAEVQLEKDKELIEAYLTENNIDAEETESGLRYVIVEEGNGPEAEEGDTAVVDFTGSTLEGKMFYTSNADQAKKFEAFEEGNPYEPLTFVIGAGEMIPGVDEGIALLKEGGKARLFLPSTLAYGSRGAGQDIKPNEIITFEVELLDLKNK